jgi:chaperone modulatory protein CbpM
MTQTLHTPVHTLTVQELAARCGVALDFVEQLLEVGILEASIQDSGGGDRLRFAGELTLRVHRCLRLQRDLGLNLEGVALVLELLDRIEQLEHELRGLRSA